VALRINTNVAALNAYRNLNATDSLMSKSLEKLSSGFRINRAADDAAGLAISEGLRSQINGLKVSVRNAQDGISMAQTAEGALNEVHAILQRVKELAVQSSNGSLGASERSYIDTESDALNTELGRIQKSTTFNGTAVFGTGAKFTFQVGNSNSTYDQISFDNTGVDLSSLISGIDLTSQGGAQSALATIGTAISSVSQYRASIGAVQNRLERTVNNLTVGVENLAASESRIRDTDMAEEMVNFTKSQILSQAGSAMLAQANQSSQGVLQLLRG
jgi:flagellin